MTTATASLWFIDNLKGQVTRPLSTRETLLQIGHMTVAAVSGGRVIRRSLSGSVQDTLCLPVSSGREVWITLEAHDLYTVRLVRKVFRGVNRGRYAIERTFEDIDCTGLSECVYGASCWK